MKAFEQASGREIAHRIVDRRPGEVAEAYADVSRARANSVGRPPATSTRCAATPGTGSAGIPSGIRPCSRRARLASSRRGFGTFGDVPDVPLVRSTEAFLDWYLRRPAEPRQPRHVHDFRGVPSGLVGS